LLRHNIPPPISYLKAAMAITIKLDITEWDSSVSAWKCDALRIPGAKVSHVFADGYESKLSSIRADVGTGRLFWADVDRPKRPARLTIDLTLAKELSTKSDTLLWKSISLLVATASTLAVALIQAGWVPGIGSDLYTIEGFLKENGKTLPAGPASFLISPPNPIKFDDGHFQIPDFRLPRNQTTSPALYIIYPGHAPQQVVLEAKPLLGGNTYDVSYASGHIVIHKDVDLTTLPATVANKPYPQSP
jgi:hypothetical protein